MLASNMRLYGAINKVEEQDDGTVKVHGIASTEQEDDQGEVVRASAMAAAIPDYMKFPAIREMHQLSAAGTALEAKVDGDGCTRIVAHVVDPVAVTKVKARVYRGFSIGGSVTSRDHVDRNIITGVKLNEISLVDRPANPGAVFDVWKAAHTEKDIAMPDGALANLADIWPEPKQGWFCGVSEHYHVGKAEAAKCLATQKASQSLVDANAAYLKEGILTYQEALDKAQAAIAASEAALAKAEEADRCQMTGKAKVDCEHCKSAASETAKDNGYAMAHKAEDTEHHQEDADAEPKGIGKKADEKPKGDYGNVTYADPGYQSDKKPRYPIDTPRHIRAAWNYINKPKNSGKYSSEQVAHIKAKIVAAWKAKIDKDGPPSAKKASRVCKSIWDIPGLVQSIVDLRALSERLQVESAMEGDDSSAPAKAQAACEQLCELLQDIVAEETDEVAEGTEIDQPIMMSTKAWAEWTKCLAESIFDQDYTEVLVSKLHKASRQTADQVLLSVSSLAMKTLMEMDGPSRADQLALAQGYDHASAALALAGGRQPELDDGEDEDEMRHSSKASEPDADDEEPKRKASEEEERKAAQRASDQKPGIDSGATEIAAPPSKSPPENATQDTRDNAETQPYENSEGRVPREPWPKASDTSRLDGFLHKAARALNASAISPRETIALLGRVDGMLKAARPPHAILCDIAHACFERVSEGVTCKADAVCPDRIGGKMMAHLDGAHAALTRMSGCSPCVPDHPAISKAEKAAKATDEAPAAPPPPRTERTVDELVNAAVADAVGKALAQRNTEGNTELFKAMSQLIDQNAKMSGLIKQIANQETPPRALSRNATGAINKAADQPTLNGAGQSESPIDTMAKSLAMMSPAQREKFHFDLDYRASRFAGPIHVASMAGQERPERQS